MESSERRKKALIQEFERVLIAKPGFAFAERALDGTSRLGDLERSAGGSGRGEQGLRMGLQRPGRGGAAVTLGVEVTGYSVTGRFAGEMRVGRRALGAGDRDKKAALAGGAPSAKRQETGGGVRLDPGGAPW
jgi:hypothetical protein